MADKIDIEPVTDGRPVGTVSTAQPAAQPIAPSPVIAVGERGASAIKRISWGAILAGVVVTLVVQLLLGILGLGIGANTINPLQEQNPTAGLGTGAAIWFLVSTLIALFAGGWVAGRLAGMPHRTDSFLHGVLTWGLTTLVTFYLLTTTVGDLISGAAGVLGQGLSLAGQGVAAAAPAVGNVVSNQLQQNGVDLNLSSIQQEAQTLLRQTGKPALQPGAIGDTAQNAVGAAKNAAGQAAQDPQAADQEFNSVLDRIAKSGQKTINAADRQALVNVLRARTDLSEQEASNTVTRWETTYSQAVNQAGATYDQVKGQASQQARETGAATADIVAKTALWTFVILLAGAAAAAFGGAAGAPKDDLSRTDGRRTV